ncbi:hypothetical protein IFM89_002622 [Coptis chinensis]|uniref:Uncharacterized protein n=1 Tax=Coptis chinensis TaxID=261450 RepID=A0A835LHE3_9MAGN|nr:hypothetical protein IFM89_002622 [Coptis chinensis]
MTTSSSSQNITFYNISSFISIKLTKDNCILWKSLFIPVLSSFDLLGFVDGSNPCPNKYVETTIANTTTRVINDKFQEWKRGDQQVLIWLNATIFKSLLLYVVGINSFFEPCASGNIVPDSDIISYTMKGLPNDYTLLSFQVYSGGWPGTLYAEMRYMHDKIRCMHEMTAVLWWGSGVGAKDYESIGVKMRVCNPVCGCASSSCASDATMWLNRRPLLRVRVIGVIGVEEISNYTSLFARLSVLWSESNRSGDLYNSSCDGAKYAYIPVRKKDPESSQCSSKLVRQRRHGAEMVDDGLYLMYVGWGNILDLAQGVLLNCIEVHSSVG